MATRSGRKIPRPYQRRQRPRSPAQAPARPSVRPNHRWETQYGATDLSADNNGDGQSNLAEYRANTNPTNAASRFQIVNASLQTNGHFSLGWSAIGGTRYRMQYANGGLTNGTFIDLVRPLDAEMDSSPPGSASTQTFTDDFQQTGAATNQLRYYRIKITP